MLKRVLRARAAPLLVVITALAAALCVVQPASAVPNTAGPDVSDRVIHTPNAVPGEYIVTLSDRTGSEPVASVANELTRRHGGTPSRVFEHALRGYAARMSPEDAAELARDPDVAVVEEDGVVTADTTQSSPPSWGLDRIDQPALPLDGAYTYNNDASLVHAYLLDTGILFSHTDFGGRATLGTDTVGDGKQGVDCDGHGTHVAGTLGGASYGAAKHVQLVAVRVLNCQGNGSIAGVVAGVDWVTANAVRPAVANMSLGGPASPSLDAAVRNSISSGITYAIAAGNDNVDACTKSPARVTEALTAGATTTSGVNDIRSSFSNYGTCVDIFAPGSSIVSDWNTGTSATQTLSGTSMATPHVAGVVALYLGAHPCALPGDVIAALKAGASATVQNAGAGSPNLLLNSTVAGSAGAYGPKPCPPGLRGSPGDTVAHLSWSVPADGGSSITGYKVYRATSSGAEVFLTNVASTSTSYDDTNVVNATAYFYKLSAVSAAGESVLSNEVPVTPAGPPAAPTLTTAPGNGTVQLSWSVPADGGSPITGYSIYRGTSSNGETLLTSSPTPSFTDTGLTNGTTYYYQVAGVNTLGTGAKSAEKSAMPQGPPYTPTLSGAPISTSTVRLTWVAPANGGSPITGYQLYRSNTSGSLGSQIGPSSISPSTTSFDDSTVALNATYFYSLVAVNALGQSQPSAAATATVDGDGWAFARGPDNGLWYRRSSGGGTQWSAWGSLGQTVASDPSVTTTSDGSVWAFARGGDGGLWYRRFSASSSQWSGWVSLGPTIVGNPVARTALNGDLYVFARGGDNGLWYRRLPAGAGSWAGWVSLGPTIVGDPSIAPAPNGDLYAFARGSDNGLWYRRLPSGAGSWAGWASLGTTIVGDPSAGVTTNGDVWAFARGGDNGLWYRRLPSGAGSWAGWATLGPNIVSDPYLALSPSGSLSVFATGADNGLWYQRFAGSWSGWVALGPTVVGGPSAVVGTTPTGAELGFDTCEAPPPSTMAAWKNASPYSTVGIYIGGENKACPNDAFLNSAWVSQVSGQGWRLLPIYVGKQAPCINFTSSQISRDLATAAAQGVAAADDAAARAGVAGIVAGKPIYFDMEGYNNGDAGCVAAVRQFVSAWAGRLHAFGYVAGMYSSLCSGILDQAAIYNDPGFVRLDAVWIAAWNGTPNIFGFGQPCALSDSLWPNRQRVHQYTGGSTETWGGIQLNIDRNAVDGPTA